MPFCLQISVQELSEAVPTDYDVMETRTKLSKLHILWTLLRALLLHCTAQRADAAQVHHIKEASVALNQKWEEYLSAAFLAYLHKFAQLSQHY